MKKHSIVASAMFLLCVMGYGVSHADWTEKIKFKGDIRLRHETISVEDKDARNRERIRLRFGAEATPREDLKIVFQLASGSDDPISTNQTLGSAFSTKSVGIDLAYLQWNPSSLSALTVEAGKIKNPFHLAGGTELVWDSDLNPEGFAMGLGGGSESLKGFFTFAALPVLERSSVEDAVLYGVQAGMNFKLDDRGTGLMLGASYFDYSNTQGFVPFYETDDGKGNSLDGSGQYLYDYNLFEGFAELGFKAGKVPANLFFDYVVNTSPTDENKGWLVGISAGKCKNPGSVAVRYNYRDEERDAVIGAFTDSDFRSGGTDAKGHEFGLDIQVAAPAKVAVTYFHNQLGTQETGYDRFQLDFNVKF